MNQEQENIKRAVQLLEYLVGDNVFPAAIKPGLYQIIAMLTPPLKLTVHTPLQQQVLRDALCEYAGTRCDVATYVDERYATHNAGFKAMKLVEVQERLKVAEALLHAIEVV